MGKYFTTKDLDKIRIRLEKVARPLKPGDMVEFTPEEWETLEKMDKWLTKVLNEAGVEAEDIIK